MFGNIQREEKLMRIGESLDRAMIDINLIVQNPLSIANVVYTTDDDGGDVFQKDNTKKFIKLEIYYDDPDGKIRNGRKSVLDGEEAALIAELDKIRKEKEKYE